MESVNPTANRLESSDTSALVTLLIASIIWQVVRNEKPDVAYVKNLGEHDLPKLASGGMSTSFIKMVITYIYIYMWVIQHYTLYLFPYSYIILHYTFMWHNSPIWA